MAVITLPTMAANSMELSLARGDSAIKLFGGGEVVITTTEALWTCRFSLAPLKGNTILAKQWVAALMQLSVLENTASVDPVGFTHDTGFTGSNPLVAGASQLGTTLNIDGGPASETILYAGEGFSVNGEFKVATQDVTTTGGGTATINFEPALRASPPDNDPVDVKTPTISMRSATPVAGLSTNLSAIYNMEVVLIEAYRP